LACGPGWRDAVLIHSALLGGYALCMWAFGRWSRSGWTAVVRPFLAMGTIWTLYVTLGRLGMTSMPYRADSWLSVVDTWLFGGVNPTLYMQRWLTPGRVEWCAFFYGLFIPYINLSLLFGSLGRAPLERDQFLTGWVFTYCISYIGYIFLPAHGPGAFLAGAYTTPLHGGYFYNLVVNSVARSGGLVGVFPSLHVASSLYLCLFDLRTNRLRGLTYVPVVLMIYAATVVLRYHYVIDLVFGTVIAFGCVHVGPRTFLRWAQGRRDAGLPALPGGEGDVLPGIPAAGEDLPAAVLPAY
jgi:hypothetical protein